MTTTTLTAAQQDYIEAIYRLEQSSPVDTATGRSGIRVSDIAHQLGTRLPTVTRSIRKLTDLGYVEHVARRSVFLSRKGRSVARELVHLHDDLVQFFTRILGVDADESERVVCQIEHGIPADVAQRFHEFMEFADRDQRTSAEFLSRFRESVGTDKSSFVHLRRKRTSGWRV
jgi:Mn-dependent DtxR family transcriptional regulator